MTSPLPYSPRIPAPGPQRALYRSVAQVMRLSQTFLPTGAMSISWNVITDMVDPYWGVPGQFQCRLDLQFTRPGKDAPMPLVAGRAPDRVGLLFFDPFPDDAGRLPVRSGDRIVMVTGPVFGTFEMRQIPEVAQDFIGAHHIECQLIEVSQALESTSLTPFPSAQEPTHPPGQNYVVYGSDSGHSADTGSVA